MVKRFLSLTLALAASLLLVSAALAAQGIKGRAALGGTLVEDITVRAYHYRAGTFGPLTGDPPAAETTTATDGTYSLDLAPGRYIVEAHKKGEGKTSGKVEDGDIYCLYSGSPVTVAVDRWTAVGLYLVKVPGEERTTSKRSRISGTLLFDGTPVERSYLYLYKTVDGAFRGPADLLQPVGKGSFSVRVPPGKYYLVARKRSRGGAYGPMDTGDLFNFYPMNPLIVDSGEEIKIEIPLIERLSQLELEEGAYRGVKVRVLDGDGKPLKGHFVLAYSNRSRTGPPSATAGPTDEKGEAYINYPPAAKHLRARSGLGGPLAEGELFDDVDAAQSYGDDENIVFRIK